MSSDSIKVVCRLRPLNKIQMANNGVECVSHNNKDITISVGGQDNKYNYAFDKVFGPKTQQVQIYKEVGVPVIKSVISGFNGTIFAYGQTGGGKTWTMEGPNHYDIQFKGLIPRTIEGLFETISETDENLEFVIKCSYVEIYNQKLFDLLDPSKSRLEIKEDKHRGVFIQNCTQISVGSGQQMLKTMDSGASNRKVAFTGMNQRSSRSHSIFIIYVNQKHIKKDSTKQSKLYFVDLAGSEKVSKTNVQGQQLEEAKNINKSLSSLGNVINALTSEKKQHVPYRDSKLTRILQESLGGNSKTTLIINCSMCTYNDKETLSTLRFGYRAKSIKNKAKVNEEKSAKELLIMLEAANKTIADLKNQLGGKIPMCVEEAQNTSLPEEAIFMVQQLRQRLEESKIREQQRQEQLKQMGLRIKNLLMELSETKQNFSNHTDTCGRIFKMLKASLNRLNKYMSRVYLDLEYWINNLIIEGTEENIQIKSNLDKTFKNIMEFTTFYDKQVKDFFSDVEIEEEIESCEKLPDKNDRSFNKKIRMIYSEPNLNENSQNLSQQLQMSCIVDKKNQNLEEGSAANSDKVSQEESFSEIQTLLESLETKQSQRIALEQLTYKMKVLSKQNEELAAKNEKLIAQNKTIVQKIEEKYEERMIDLEERVQQYRLIIKAKDSEITNFLKEIEKEKKMIADQKVVAQRFKKIIQSNGSLKNYYEMEEKVRSLASERQKIFNELYKLRNELDEAELSIQEKQEHIESLKKVMQELNSNTHPEAEAPLNQKQIEKKYNREIYGTDSRNVVVAIKGGSKHSESGGGRSATKKSSLRKKVNVNDNRSEQKKSILPFIKGFFS